MSQHRVTGGAVVRATIDQSSIRGRGRRLFSFDVSAVTTALLLTGSAAAETAFVSTQAAPGGDGTSWLTAFDDIQDALDAARADSTITDIWVAVGTYTPDRGSGDRTASFDLVSGVALLGGFDGTEDSADERDPVTNVTILSGDLLGDDGPNFANIADNTRVIVNAVGGGPAPIIDGFTITRAHNDVEISLGGGMFADAEDLVIRQCCFFENTTLGSGGAFCANGNGHVTIEDCVIDTNRAINGRPGGGILFSVGANATITDTTFVGNFTLQGIEVNPGSGGGLHLFRCDQVDLLRCHFENNTGLNGAALSTVLSKGITMTDCSFIGNHATGFFGGAVNLNRSDNPPIDDHPTVITNCQFINNTIDPLGEGSAIFATENVVEIANSSFIGNVAGGMSEISGDFLGFGTIHIEFEVGHRIENCLFAGNTGAALPGIVISQLASVQLTNNSIINNISMDWPSGSGLHVTGNAAVNMDNNILWGNRGVFGESVFAGQSAQIELLAPGLSSVDHTIIEGFTGSIGGAGMSGDDPMFIDADGPDDMAGTVDDDARLATDSPAIDAGNNGALTAGLDTDLDGLARFVDDPATIDTGIGNGPIIDFGAYEFQAGGPVLGDLDGDGAVGAADLAMLLGAWGECERDCPADLDGDGTVNAADLALLLGNWG